MDSTTSKTLATLSPAVAAVESVLRENKTTKRKAKRSPAQRRAALMDATTSKTVANPSPAVAVVQSTLGDHKHKPKRKRAKRSRADRERRAALMAIVVPTDSKTIAIPSPAVAAVESGDNKTTKRAKLSHSNPKTVLAPTTSKAIATPSPTVVAVESILRYQFKDKSLLEAALTHPSYMHSESYQRLELIGEAALSLALVKLLFVTYPDLHPGQLTSLRAANFSTEKLARVALRNGLYNHMRHAIPHMNVKVKEFALSVEEEGDEIFAYGGKMKAPKVLADLVESVAAAVYVDCNFDLNLMWEYISPLLEPLVTLENIKQPVTMMHRLCDKMGKKVECQQWKKASKNICNVFVDGRLVSQSSSDHQDTAKLTAATEALGIMNMTGASSASMDIDGALVVTEEIKGAKQKLREYCNKRRWPKPTYRYQSDQILQFFEIADNALLRRHTGFRRVSNGAAAISVTDAFSQAWVGALSWLRHWHSHGRYALQDEAMMLIVIFLVWPSRDANEMEDEAMMLMI